MNRSLALALVSLSLSAAARDPETSCTVEAGPNDVVRKKGDVVVEAGQALENVIALDGSVTLHKGAHVKTVIALRGDATIEEGATVDESVITVAGRAHVKGTVSGSRIEVRRGSIRLVGEKGDSLSGDLTIDDTTLSKLLVDKVLEKVDACVLKTAHASLDRAAPKTAEPKTTETR
jgi:NDP-sugar pyrophosphorylase family protein